MARGQNWQLRAVGLAEALEFFEITRPVTVRASNGRSLRGRHRWVDGEHRITISTYSSPEKANRTLMHELTHAMQRERWVNAETAEDKVIKRAKWRRARSGRYYTRPCEVEARDNEWVAEEITAVVPRGWTAGLHGKVKVAA